jgi:hypothetical protein
MEPLDEEYNNDQLVFPAAEDYEDPALVTGADSRRAIRWSHEIAFSVHVPAKNQPTYFRLDTVASEDYYAFWDGYTLLVGWTGYDDDRVGAAGGQVVIDIVRDAAVACGCDIYVQACMPTCHHLFAHANLRIREDPTEAKVRFEAGRDPDLIVRVPTITPAVPALGYFFWLIGGSFEEFAFTKNRARRVLDLEQVTRETLLDLMRVEYSRAHILEHRLRDRPKMRWMIRGWKKQARVSLAKVWLGLAAIEETRRDWGDWRNRFRGISADYGTELIFSADRRDDDTAVESLNTSLIQTGVQDASTRLASRALVNATAAAGVAAIVGVIIGHFL